MRYNEKGNLVIETEYELRDIAIEGAVDQVDEFFVKHDVTNYTIVFVYDNLFWQVSYNQSYNNGVEMYGPEECMEVEKKDVVVSKWVRKEGK